MNHLERISDAWSSPYVLVWFRRDLRLDDNPALSAAIALAKQLQLPLKALFIATPEQWKQHDMAPIQADFILRHLQALAADLAEQGVELTTLEVAGFKEQSQAITTLCSTGLCQAVFANTEPEVNEVQRDQILLDAGLPLKLFEADVIVPKGRVVKGDGEMFKVFTPFKRAWIKALLADGLKLAENNRFSDTPLQQEIATLSFSYPKEESGKWPLAQHMASQVWPEFLARKHDQYAAQRDFPAVKGTSGLSPYLAIGAISPRRLVADLLAVHPSLLNQEKSETFSWLNELIWRDFYKHLLFHFPYLCRHKNFNAKYDVLLWPNNPEFFKAWCEGKTGYPIVDAAMRQLKATGWMHNRLRMIVASFLCKHLLVDWRWGERYFIQHLIDGDLSANNGGWQWSAGTGCDAQPYFRVFNPITQSKKFDPSGEFIRKYCYELENVPDKYIHFPADYLLVAGNEHHYPVPIVDHPQARQQALDFYQIVKAESKE